MPKKTTLIDSICLKNFKAFQDTGTLPLKKITLLVGKNSAGKSSLIKSILGASQTSRQTSPDDTHFRLIGDYTNLGTYTDTVHENDANTDFSIEFGIIDPKDRVYNLQYTFCKNEKNPLGTSLKGIKVHHEGKFLLSGGKPLKNQPKDRSGFGHLGILLSRPKMTNAEYFEKKDNQGFNPEVMKKLQELMNDTQRKEGKEEAKILQINIRDFAIDVSKKGMQGLIDLEGLDEIGRHIGDTVLISRLIDSVLDRAIYLSGVREEPTREARLAQSSGNRVGIKGESLAIMLHQRRNNKEFMDKFNRHLQVLEIAEKATTAPSYMKSEGKEVETGYIKILLQKQGKNRTLMDLGFGTSQVLPVVFELGLRRNRLILIEQPELHLHPAAQSEIGSLLSFSIEQGNQLIVETHSANLIERLRKLIREGKLSNKDVNIIYIGKDEQNGGSRCDVIGFDEKGEFTEAWPEESFFGERELEYLDW